MAARKESRKSNSKKRAIQKSSLTPLGVVPSTRTFSLWSTKQIRQAEIQADMGNIRLAANLSDWIMADDRVAGTLDTRVQSLMGLDPIFERSGDRRKSAKVVKALELQEDWWASYQEPEISQMMSWGIILGLAPLRHRWFTMPGHGNRVLPMPEFWHPQHLRYDYTTRKWMVKVDNEGNRDIEEELIPGGGDWILHTPHGINRPWSRGAWRGLAPLVLMKHLALQDWMNHSEKASVLTITQGPDALGLGEAPVGDDRSSERERQALAQSLYERGREAVVLLPPGFDLKLVEAVANTQHLYESQVEMANTAIAIMLRGGNLTTEVQSGSRAAAEAQERLGDEVKRRFDGQAFTSTIHDQSLTWWAEYNFGDPALAPWPIFPIGPRKDMQARAASLDAAAKACMNLQKFGYVDAFDPEKWAEEFELTGLLKDKYEFKPQIILDQKAIQASIDQGASKAGDSSTTGAIPQTSPDTFAENDKQRPSNFYYVPELGRTVEIKDSDLELSGNTSKNKDRK